MKYYKLYQLINSISYKTTGMVHYQLHQQAGTLYVLFPGTPTWKHWILNFIFLPIAVKPYKKMTKIWKCHFGFALQWNSGNDEVMRQLAEYVDQNKPDNIVFAGNSNGGAMAQLAAEDYFSDTVNVLML